jgi:hypothetical protein
VQSIVASDAFGNEQTVVRLSVNLSSEASAVLRQMAQKRGVSITEEVRRCISVQYFLDDAINKGNKILLLERDRGDIKEISFPS